MPQNAQKCPFFRLNLALIFEKRAKNSQNQGFYPPKPYFRARNAPKPPKMAQNGPKTPKIAQIRPETPEKAPKPPKMPQNAHKPGKTCEPRESPHYDQPDVFWLLNP